MSPTVSDRLATESTLVNQHSLMGIAQSIRNTLRERDCDLTDLQSPFAELRGLLRDRVREEEEGAGVLQQTMFEAPFLTALVQQLLQQLCWLKEQIELLDSRVQQAEQDPACGPVLRVQFDDFFEDLVNYENGLHSLRFNAICDDDEA